MKKRFFLSALVLLFAGAVNLQAAGYVVRVDLTEMQINGATVFSGDTTIRIHTSGKNANERHTIYKSGSWEIAMSFEIKPGGKDPSLKKYGAKGKTWRYIRHTWYRKDNGEWNELSGGPMWSYIQRDGRIQVTDTVTSTGTSGIQKFKMAYGLAITKE
jgi:hypothetical protein